MNKFFFFGGARNTAVEATSRLACLLVVMVFSTILFVGCEEKKANFSDFEAPTRNASDNDPRWKDALFSNAMENLNQLENHEGEETGDRVTGRLNEWIKTIAQTKHWDPDTMVPDWIVKIQSNLPQFTSAAEACQSARHDLAKIFGKLQRIALLNQQLTEIEKLGQKLGGPENLRDSALSQAGEINEELQALIQELKTLNSPESLKAAPLKLKRIAATLQEQAAPSLLADEENVEAINAVASMLDSICQHGPLGIPEDNFNDFLKALEVLSDWLQSIPGALDLNGTTFPASDIHFLTESVWFRDASRWAQGENANDFKKIQAMFDWTIKNISLISPLDLRMTSLKTNQPSNALTPLPAWQILLTGRGTPEERAWVFSKLAAQQGLDVVLIRVPCSTRPDAGISADNNINSESVNINSKSLENNINSKSHENVDEKSTAPDSANPNPSDPSPQIEFAPQEATITDTPTESAKESEKADKTESADNSSSAGKTVAPELPDLPSIHEIQQPEKILAAWISEDNIYLFDPELGVPIPALNGISLPKQETSGQGGASDKTTVNHSLLIQPATWQAATSQPGIFTQLDYSIKSGEKERQIPYPIRCEDLANAEFLIPVEPESFSKRMWILQSRLTGNDVMALTSVPSALAERIKKQAPNHSISLWDRPFESVSVCPLRFSASTVLFYSIIMTKIKDTSPLQRGRVLYLKGNLTAALEGDESAVSWFQKARLSDVQLDTIQNQEQNIRYRFVRLFATYWLGLLSDAHNRHEAAADYFRQASKQGQEPIWIAPALYNQGRVEEEMGNFDEAKNLYRQADRLDPLNSVNEIRARWLEKFHSSCNQTPPSEGI